MFSSGLYMYYVYMYYLPTIMLQIFPIIPKQDVMKVARPQIQKLMNSNVSWSYASATQLLFV